MGMVEMMEITEKRVTIPLDRYESLLDTETRETVLRDYIKRNRYADREIMMRILGCHGDADEIKRSEELERERLLKENTEVKEDAGTT